MMVRFSGILVIAPSSTKNKQKSNVVRVCFQRIYPFKNINHFWIRAYMLEHHVKEFETFDLIFVNWCGDF